MNSVIELVAAGRTLPGDALETLAEHGIIATRRGDRVVLASGDTAHELALAHFAGPGMPPPELISDVSAGSGLPVLVALPSTSKRLAKRLDEERLHWVDLAGNASIHLPGLVVAIQGRPAVNVARRYAVSAAFRPAGLQVVVVVMMFSGEGIPTLRRLAEAAGVSLGAAQASVADLRAQGYIDERGRLSRGGELLDRWAAVLAAQESGRWDFGAFQGEPGWWDHADAFRDDDARLGGEAGAEASGLPLRSLTGIIYADQLPTQVIRAGRLRRVEEGNVRLRPKFWSVPGEGWIAPSPIIYAELLASDDPRQSEIAAEMRATDALLRRLRD